MPSSRLRIGIDLIGVNISCREWTVHVEYVFYAHRIRISLAEYVFYSQNTYFTRRKRIARTENALYAHRKRIERTNVRTHIE